MQALVTGGAGFIGSHVVRQLLGGGATVVILDNLSSGYACNVPTSPRVHFLQGDIGNRAQVEEAIAGCSVVFHLAASVGNTRALEDPLGDSTVNVLGTLTVLEAMRRHGVRKIVYSSSAAIFGEVKQLPIPEDHPLDPPTPYGVSKLAGELHCLAYAKLYAIEAVCLRYFNVYGPHQRFDAYGNVIPIFAKRLLERAPLQIFGDGEQTRDFVNVRDVAQANLLGGKAQGITGVYNIGSGHAVTIRQLVVLLQQAAGMTGTVEMAPPRAGDIRDSRAEIAAARRALGFAPGVPLADGLQEYIAWMKTDGL